MATRKRSPNRGRIKVNKLKANKEAEELSKKEAKKVKGGIIAILIGKTENPPPPK